MGSSNLAIQPSWAPSSFAVCCLWWDFHSQLHNQASKGLSVRCWVSFSQQLLGQLLSCLVELEVKPKLLDSVQPMSVPALDKVLHVSLEVHQVLAKDLHQALDKDLLQALDKDLLPFLEEVEVFLLDFLPLSSPLKLSPPFSHLLQLLWQRLFGEGQHQPVCHLPFQLRNKNALMLFSLQMLSITLSTKWVIMISRPTFLKQNPEMEKLFRVLTVMLIQQEHL